MITQSFPETFDNSVKTPLKIRFWSISRKLLFGFGMLVIITLVAIGFSYLGSTNATFNIQNTAEFRSPTALASARAQGNLLRISADVRGYLALGEPRFREQYILNLAAFKADLQALEALSSKLSPKNKADLVKLKQTFEEWVKWPDDLFALRDDQFDREPAYQLLMTTGTDLAGNILIEIGELIDRQSNIQEPTIDDLALLANMAQFQGSFAAMFSALRGYVTTQNRIFRLEYEANQTLNDEHWKNLWAKTRFRDKSSLNLDTIKGNREQFLYLPEQIFEILESERWREDLYLFRTEILIRTDSMLQLLRDLTNEQQDLLEEELEKGVQGLGQSDRRIFISGVIALLLALGLAVFFRSTIALPIRHLTAVAEQIHGGDLEAQAQVESKDEIGVLAETFNSMTSQLRQTLVHVQIEKNRADDLLDVVIPIGVELTSERDFNLLLERMLLEAKTFCHADAGTLYLLTEDRHLQFQIVRNDTKNIAMGGTTGNEVTFASLPLPSTETTGTSHCYIATQVAMSGMSQNIPDLNHPSEIIDDYLVHSLLTIPLKNSAGQVRGVLQLLNAQNPETHEIIPFDQNLQQMMESFSSLAVAALEAYIREQSLRQEIQQLRIEIDEVKRQKHVREITETESFQDLQAKAAEMRRRRSKHLQKKDTSADRSPSSQA